MDARRRAVQQRDATAHACVRTLHRCGSHALACGCPPPPQPIAARAVMRAAAGGRRGRKRGRQPCP
eukprot:7695030-Alexandrium_andersonii.AAC.1